MTKQNHLTSGLLVKAMDAEVTSAEAASVMEHLAQCDECRQKHEDLRHTSFLIESGLAAIAVGNPLGERESLQQRLEAPQPARRSGQTPERVMWRFGWGMAIAAGLALAIVMAPRHKNTTRPQQQSARSASFVNAIEVAGETFVPLPFSNPDLPVNESRIIEMQVPVSALNDVGIVLESVSNRESPSDRSVLADVLMGTDGQPLGVHVLE